MGEKYIAVSLTLLTAFLYYAGWTFLYHYYFFLGIDLFEVSPSVQYTLIFAFPALAHIFSPQGELYPMIAALILGAAVLYIFYRLTIGTTAGNHIIALICVAIAGLMLFEGYRAAKSLAQMRAIDKWMNDSNPTFLDLTPRPVAGNNNKLPGPSNPLSSALASANDQFRLRHILSTPQFHYLFTREDCDAAEYQMCDGILFRVKVSEGSLTNLQPGVVKDAR